MPSSLEETDRSTSRIIADVFATITAVPRVEAPLAEMIAMETLFDAHHPAIGTFICLLSYDYTYSSPDTLLGEG